MNLEAFFNNITERLEANGNNPEIVQEELNKNIQQTKALMAALRLPPANPDASAHEMICRHCGQTLQGRKNRREHLKVCVGLKRRKMLEKLAEERPELRKLIREAYNATI